MRIYVSYPYFDLGYDENTQYMYYIANEDDYDVEVLSKIIKEGDFIRIKRLFWIIVQNVNFIETPSKMIEIKGRKYGMIDQTVQIKAIMEIEIEAHIENTDKIKKLEKIVKENTKYEMHKKAISTKHIQNEGF